MIVILTLILLIAIPFVPAESFGQHPLEQCWQLVKPFAAFCVIFAFVCRRNAQAAAQRVAVLFVIVNALAFLSAEFDRSFSSTRPDPLAYIPIWFICGLIALSIAYRVRVSINIGERDKQKSTTVDAPTRAFPVIPVADERQAPSHVNGHE